MNSSLFGRELGTISPQTLQRGETTRLLDALESAPGIEFDGSDTTTPSSSSHDRTRGGGRSSVSERWAHRAGVNCLAIEKFEGRYMLSGGAESSIVLWDLEKAENTSKQSVHRPVATLEKSSASHKFGITHLSFYPFDSQAFLSSSYDHSLKIYSTENLSPSASFDLDSVVYSHALSPIADHLLVACATQQPAVRLVDLRSGARAHSLAGHQGAVLSIAWSPLNDHLLVSGGADGTVRLWDIRRGVGSLGVLDLEDSVGVEGFDGYGNIARSRRDGKAHIGACNGLVWTDDGRFLITAGHDERVRVWNMRNGANMLSHFGPLIKNTHLATLLPMLPPSHVVSPGIQVMMYPNEKEILMFDIFEGTLLKRFRAPGIVAAQAQGSKGQRNMKSKVVSLAWRTNNVEMYSAHSDGAIRGWLPRTCEEIDLDEDEAQVIEGEGEDRKRKRQVLDEIFRDLTKQKITFN